MADKNKRAVPTTNLLPPNFYTATPGLACCLLTPSTAGWPARSFRDPIRTRRSFQSLEPPVGPNKASVRKLLGLATAAWLRNPGASACNCTADGARHGRQSRRDGALKGEGRAARDSSAMRTASGNPQGQERGEWGGERGGLGGPGRIGRTGTDGVRLCTGLFRKRRRRWTQPRDRPDY